MLVKIGFMAYYVWFRRNKVVFEEPTRQTRAWSIWCARRARCVKRNVDGTIYDGGWVGLGVVAWDHLGCVLFAAPWAWWPPEVADAKIQALFLVIKLARGHNVKHAIAEILNARLLLNTF